MKNNEYRLRIGDSVLGMRFRPARYTALFRDYLGRECAREEPDVRMDFRITSRQQEAPVDNSLFTSKLLTNRGFEISGGLIKGHYDRAAQYGKIRVHEALMVVPTIRVFEQLLYQAFFSSKDGGSRDAYLIHSCGVIHGGSGYLFVGPSESGKSTVARLSLPDTVLNDELNLLLFSDNKITLCGTPFNGLFKEKSEGYCELESVFLLRQGLEHKLVREPGAEAVKAVLREIVPPIGLDEVITPQAREEMLDLAIRLRETVPVYRMEFQPNRGFWQLIDQKIGNERGRE